MVSRSEEERYRRANVCLAWCGRCAGGEAVSRYRENKKLPLLCERKSWLSYDALFHDMPIAL